MLGCGSTGRCILKKEPRFTVVDQEGDLLAKEGYNAVKGDPSDRSALEKAGIEKASVVVIVEKGPEVIEAVRTLNPDAFILHIERPRKGEENVLVIPTDEGLAQECLSQIRGYEKLKRKEALEKVLHSGKNLAIIMHDNPDPDCISSALSLKLIAEKLGVNSSLFYGGQVGYSENKALVKLLNLTLLSPESDSDFSSYDITAFVDHSPWDYTSIAKNINPDIVIDHHISPQYQGKFMDIREDVGATNTILMEYLQLFEVDVDAKLATALFYGLLVDTSNFRRGMHQQDIEALEILRKKMSLELLSQIERAGVSWKLPRTREVSESLNVLGDALKNMEFRDDVIFSFIGKVKYRDEISNSADFLLKMEKANIVLAYGIIGDSLCISARSWNEKLHLGKLMREAFHELGRAGGHPLIGGASIPLSNLPGDFREDIMRRFLKVIPHHHS